MKLQPTPAKPQNGISCTWSAGSRVTLPTSLTDQQALAMIAAAMLWFSDPGEWARRYA